MRGEQKVYRVILKSEIKKKKLDKQTKRGYIVNKMVNTTDGTSNGKNSFMIGIRLPDSVWPILKGLAEGKGMTMSGYVKDRIMYLVAKAGSVNTTVEASRSVNTEGHYSVNKPTKVDLQAMIHKIEQGTHTPDSQVPWYDSSKHGEGDVVRMKDPRTGEVKVVTI